MSYELVPDPIIHAYREACQADASTEWHHFMSFVSGYKSAMLLHPTATRDLVIPQLQFLWSMALQRSNMADHVFRRN